MHPTSTSDLTGQRLGRAILGYLAMAVAVVTLSPFRFSLEPVNRLTEVWGTFDLVMNVVMFVPIGFIHQLSRPHGKPAWRSALVLGAALSGLIEAAQFFTPGRYPSLFDLVTNTAGAGLGAWIAGLALGRADAARTVRAFAVELPLMGLVYLLAPLLWLVGLGSEGDTRAWIILPLTAAAGWIIGAVFTGFDRAPRSRILLATAAWLVVALVPGAFRSLGLTSAAAAMGLGAAWIRSVAPARFTHETHRDGAPRRFESSTLRLVLPLFIAYLVVSSLTPPAIPDGRWSGTLALLPAEQSASNGAIFRALEHIAAFTLIGYAIAEYHGRSRDRFRTVAPAVLAWAALSTAALELARGWHPEYRASATMFALTLLGAGLGGWLYILQLAHVRALTARQSPT
ncbi:MAG: VanZ family protein [Gemmatimonadetes bacterium]|nr:VanZ family protein [Gemmatimonadota bacterium]